MCIRGLGYTGGLGDELLFGFWVMCLSLFGIYLVLDI